MTALWRFVGKVLVVALTVGAAATAGQVFYARIGSVQAPGLSDRHVVPAYRPAAAPSPASTPPARRSELTPPPAPAPPGAAAPQVPGPAVPPALAAAVPNGPLVSSPGTAPAKLRAHRPARLEDRADDVVDLEAALGLRRGASDCQRDQADRAGAARHGSGLLGQPGATAGAGQGARPLSCRTRERP